MRLSMVQFPGPMAKMPRGVVATLGDVSHFPFPSVGDERARMSKRSEARLISPALGFGINMNSALAARPTFIFLQLAFHFIPTRETCTLLSCVLHHGRCRLGQYRAIPAACYDASLQSTITSIRPHPPVLGAFAFGRTSGSPSSALCPMVRHPSSPDHFLPASGCQLPRKFALSIPWD